MISYTYISALCPRPLGRVGRQKNLQNDVSFAGVLNLARSEGIFIERTHSHLEDFNESDCPAPCSRPDRTQALPAARPTIKFTQGLHWRDCQAGRSQYRHGSLL